MAVYCVCLLQYGQQLAIRVPSRISDQKVLILLSLAWLPVSMAALLIPGDPFFKLLYLVVFYLMNAYPSAIGLITHRRFIEEQECKRFRRNVDGWLAEWECEETDTDLEDDWNAILKGHEEDK